MAENTDVNVKDNNRQSRDDPLNFSVNTSVPMRKNSNLDDTEVFCVSPKSTSKTVDMMFKSGCHEMFGPNQRPKKSSAAWDETPSDKSSDRNSISSIDSLDSGYDSKRCTRIFSIPEYDEFN